MKAFELVGYMIEACWLTIWQSKLVEPFRLWYISDPDNPDLVAMVVISLVWGALTLWGYA